MRVAPRVFRAPEGPAAREARRPHFVRRRASKPARALRALRTCGAWCVDVRFGASARCPARPRHRPRAPQPGTPGSPAPSAPVVPGAGEGCAQTADHFGENGRNWGVSGEVVCVLGTLWLWVRRGAQARWPGGVKPLSPLLVQAEPQLKPSPPLLACACVGLKPPSPLRVRNGRFWCSFWAQR